MITPGSDASLELDSDGGDSQELHFSPTQVSDADERAELAEKDCKEAEDVAECAKTGAAAAAAAAAAAIDNCRP